MAKPGLRSAQLAWLATAWTSFFLLSYYSDNRSKGTPSYLTLPQWRKINIHNLKMNYWHRRPPRWSVIRTMIKIIMKTKQKRSSTSCEPLWTQKVKYKPSEKLHLNARINICAQESVWRIDLVDQTVNLAQTFSGGSLWWYNVLPCCAIIVY